MKPTNRNAPSKTKTIIVFLATIIIGFILFVLPNIFFGVTKTNDGLKGINLLYMALFQLLSVLALIYYSLKVLKKDFNYIGLTNKKWKTDALLGLFVGLCWTGCQFLWIIPSTGGAKREDISQAISMMDGTTIGLLSLIALGVIGGGIAEEIYNRGYFISVLKSVFKNQNIGLWVSAILSILFFALGHLPTDTLGWFDILIPTIAYTLLFIFTKRLTAPMIAHGIYNMTAILSTYQLYYA